MQIIELMFSTHFLYEAIAKIIYCQHHSFIPRKYLHFRSTFSFSLDISIKNLNRKWNLSVVVSNPPRKNIKLFPLIGHPSGILVRLKRTQKGNSTPYQWWFLKSTLIFITWILIHGNIWGHCNSKLDWLIATRRTTVGWFSLWILHTIQPVLSTWHLPAPSPRGLMHVGAQHSPTGGAL